MRTCSAKSWRLAGPIALIALLASASARAELGGTIATVPSDQLRMKSAQPARVVTTTASYSIHEFTTDIGLTIREYAANDGTVFAVTWRGPAKPDLQQLLGRYFPLFTMAGAQAKNPGTGPLAVRTDDLIVYSGGHPRAFNGHAYVPSLIPAGVSIDALQ